MTRYNKTVAILMPKRDLEQLEDCEKEMPAPGGKRARAARRG